jgi:redox-sensitive bicupin YhaK (pirin superfamily)
MGVLQLRPAHSLPQTQLPWLELRDHFIATVGPSAGQGRALGPLRVLADATFAPHSRFPLHGHRDMEILSIVVDGELSHHGDQAQGALLAPRSAQLISARDGIVHAEGNDTDGPTRMLQIWFTPYEHGGAPAYFDRQLPAARGRHVVAGDEVLPLRCDARVWWLDVDGSCTLKVDAGRLGYLVVLAGPLRIEEASLATGDGAELDEGEVVLEASAGAALWIDFAE